MNDLFDFGDEFTGNIVFVDYSNLSIRNGFAVTSQDPYDNKVWNKWTKKTATDLVKQVDKFNADRLIVCVDSKNCWRKDYYPEYKANRIAFRKKAIIDIDNLMVHARDFINKFASIFTNVVVIQVDRCESDDIIAILTKHHRAASNIIILSSDKDFNQLLIYDNVSQFDILAKKYVNLINPEFHIEMKIITGDINDNIPAIKKGAGKKFAETIINTDVDILDSSDENLVKNFKRNRILIDFKCIPSDIEKSIISNYKSINLCSPSGRSVYGFISSYVQPEIWQRLNEKILKLR